MSDTHSIPDAVEVTAIVSVSPAGEAPPAETAREAGPASALPTATVEPQLSIRDTIVARVKRESTRFAILFLLGTTLLASWHYVIAAYGDIDDFYTLADTAGPFAVAVDASGTLTRGVDTASFGKGEYVGWSSSFCAVPGRPFTGLTEMVRLPQDGLKEAVENSRTTHFPGTVTRCGPRTYSLRVPDEAVPGVYELRRTLTFREGTAWPLHAHFPSIPFRVVGAAPATPPTSGVHLSTE